MSDFGSCSNNVAEIPDDQFCKGFRGCGNADGVEMTSRNVNGVLKRFQDGIRALQNATDNVIVRGEYETGVNDIILHQAEGGTVPIDLDPLLGQVDQKLAAALPAGIISLWSGSVASIPTGWALCDGQNGTPDLRDRFVIGAGGGRSVGTKGGAEDHDHSGMTGQTALDDSMVPDHRHLMASIGAAQDARLSAGAPMSDYSNSIGGDTQYILRPTSGDASVGLSSGPVDEVGAAITTQGHDHTIPSASHLPPFYALAYIMKV